MKSITSNGHGEKKNANNKTAFTFEAKDPSAHLKCTHETPDCILCSARGIYCGSTNKTILVEPLLLLPPAQPVVLVLLSPAHLLQFGEDSQHKNQRMHTG